MNALPNVSNAKRPISRRPLAKAVVFFFMGLGLFGFLIGGMFSFELIAREVRRMEPWKAALFFCGDIVSFFWFMQFFTRHFLLERDFEDRAATPKQARWQAFLVVFTMALGIAIDGYMSAMLLAEEEEKFAGGQQVWGKADVVLQNRGASGTIYELHYWFTDANGTKHREMMHLFESEQDDFAAGVSPKTARNIKTAKQQRMPFDIEVVYDADWPERNWLKEVGVELDVFALSFRGLSLVILAVQGVGLVVFFVFVWRKHEAERIPWWHDFHKIVPFMVEGTLLGVFAFLGWLLRGKIVG